MAYELHQEIEPHSARVLDPVARISEILFGLIMALTFTGTLSAATAGREEIRTLLIGMIGCNIAWGLVDAVMFLMQTLSERGRGLITLRAVHEASDVAEAHLIIAGAIPPVIRPLLGPEAYERIRLGLLHLHLPSQPGGFISSDWPGALAIFLLVFLSTFPLVIPFLVFRDVHIAIRVSNLVAIVLLFGCGYALARHAGYRPLRTGFGFVLVGVVLVAITIALGGCSRETPARAAMSAGPGERITATAVSASTVGFAPSTVPIDINIERWSTDRERDQLADALTSRRANAMLDRLRALPVLGVIATPSNPGSGLRFAQTRSLDDGGRQVVVASDRPTTLAGDADYPLTFVDIRFDKNGNGTGTLAYAATLTYDKNTQTIAIEGYGREPVRLTNVRSTPAR